MEKCTKVVFGIQLEQIKFIDSELKRWSEIPIKGDTNGDLKMEYSVGFWQCIAPKVGWDAFTLALDYLESRDEKKHTGR